MQEIGEKLWLDPCCKSGSVYTTFTSCHHLVVKSDWAYVFGLFSSDKSIPAVESVAFDERSILELDDLSRIVVDQQNREMMSGSGRGGSSLATSQVRPLTLVFNP